MKNPIRTGLAALLPCTLLAGTAQAQFSFDPPVALAAGTQPSASVLADFNGDGNMDLAVTSDGPEKVGIRFGDGLGGFGALIPVLTGGGTGAHTPVAGDLDGDMDVDIAVSLQNVDRVQILVNNGAGGFTLGNSFVVGTRPRSMAIGNLDGDTDLDLVVSNRDSNDVSVLLNQGGMSFTVASYATGQEPREVDIGDMTGDEVADIAVSAHDTREVVVLRNLGGGTFVNAANLSVGANQRPDGLAVADLNGDQLADIVAATNINTGTEFAAVFLATGGGAFSGPTYYPLIAQNAGSVAAADFDLDGDVDVVTANQDSNDINLLAGNGAGALGAAQVIAVGTAPTHVTAGRIDIGQSPDLVVTNDTSNDVSVLLNQQSETLSYCTAGTTASGCTATLSASGTASATAPSGFTVSASGVEGNKDGLLFFGTNGRQANPWGNGTSFQCVAPPVKRAGLLTGVGTNGQCNGSFSQDLNAHWSAKPAKNPGAGAIAQVQLWFRDPLNPSNQTTSLSDAIEFTVYP
jgi:hypothetical protein